MEKRALISVSDKTGIVEFAKELTAHFGYTILSTGGTAKLLAEKGIPVTEVSDYTGFPEMMDGRVKTLHPKIHGGLLSLRSNEQHMAQAKEHGIGMIDLVVVNLYPFEATVAKPNCTLEDAIENIDIGGPSMLRSAAKNHASVTVVCDNNDFPKVLDAMRQGGEVLQDLRKKLALKVYQRTSAYDAAISTYLNAKYNGEGTLPETLNIGMGMVQKMRYGENPHQSAALYGDFGKFFRQLQGKELSYNNIIDISAATWLIAEFEKPTLAILKHTNPCGVASCDNLVDAWNQAFETDKQAPFGGIIVMNRKLEADLAQIIAGIFSEVIIAPDFSDEALEILAKKKNLRLMISTYKKSDALQFKSVIGGLLAQSADAIEELKDNMEVVTKRQPTEEEWRAMLFGWKVVKHVKSNAIVYAGCERTLGIGAGQMSRVDSSQIAVWKAEQAGLSLKGSVVASDAFFPFADGLVAAAKAGATAAIQPGGSVRDAEVIEAANENNMAMVFTKVRHFRH
ncbi:MAG: bifunctional phosphoribosylaminoimidazolecarboxamide formyltransferase/IMP cyclohydrolase [Opitutales bacterium]|nr:bifunctional phosphoribosylaminoimidazolecarboxamide formyltransferase/IMP cyclohydrolase [Opitutales bacterium]